MALASFACARTTEDVGGVRRSLDPTHTDVVDAGASAPTSLRFCSKGESAAQTFCFDAVQFVEAANAVALRVESCHRAGEPAGDGSARLTFDPTSGTPTAIAVEAPFSGTAEGACIASLYSSVRVPPFAGSVYSATVHFRVRALDASAPPPARVTEDGGATFGGFIPDGG